MITPIEFNPLMTTINDWKKYATHLRSELTKAEMKSKINVIEVNKVLSVQIDVKDNDGFFFECNISNENNNLLQTINSEINESLSYYIRSKLIILKTIYEEPRKTFYSFRKNDSTMQAKARRINRTKRTSDRTRRPLIDVYFEE